ncbi:hypothetical protein DP73_20505 [Desulfosporosinus sp. HMP52]|uniref:tetratricopeptide repeat protein n=1 Tax=Desulfosporosinus sp. HMP52 TaxID=1487923 RepID=UPI00051FDCC9|nr:hypothetical protein [Desulfosporosinus sp. HMP52]KGK82448.1 hypothetical protein DP73_20505 [Desulfosporosinus sp. HMP52]
MTIFWTRKNIYIGLITLLFIVSIPSGVYAFNNYSYNQMLKSAEMLLEKEDFDQAITNYNMALAYKTETDFINEKLNNALRQQKSKENFDEATLLFEQKEYLKAIEAFRQVDALDMKYHTKSQEIIAQYRNDNLNKAKQEAINQKYSDAISYLDIILDFDPSNSDANTLKNRYTKELAIIEEGLKKSEAEKIAQKQASNKLESAKKSGEQTIEKNPTQIPTVSGRPLPRAISTSGPFTLSLLDSVSSNGNRGFRFFITGPKDSQGCEVTGAAQSDSKLILYNGTMPYDGFTNIGILVQNFDTPPGKYQIGFSIKYNNKEYSLGGSVKLE